jgi:hypothetical protein
VPKPLLLPEGYEIRIGFGRFITSCAPSAAEREAAQALLTQLGAGKDLAARIEISPNDLTMLSHYNPDAKPQEW